jgi:hypothetical protein
MISEKDIETIAERTATSAANLIASDLKRLPKSREELRAICKAVALASFTSGWEAASQFCTQTRDEGDPCYSAVEKES